MLSAAWIWFNGGSHFHQSAGMDPMPKPSFARIIEALPETVPFVGPEALERTRGRPFRARIGANESVFGPSPVAVEAMAAAAGEVWKY